MALCSLLLCISYKTVFLNCKEKKDAKDLKIILSGSQYFILQKYDSISISYLCSNGQTNNFFRR